MTASPALIAITAVALGALAGCNAGADPGHRSSPNSPSTSTTTATPAAPTLPPVEVDLNAARDAVVRYWHVLDELGADPHKSLNLVAKVARGQAASQARVTLGTYQANGWTQTGQSIAASMAASTTDDKTFTVRACRDVSKVGLLDRNGKSVVRPGRPSRQQFTYAVEKAPQGFFVTIDTLKGKPC